ncbi:cathepsin L1-like [Brachionus plicatilis]|uniref:Cathepsin L1-like n=1 Tax=Brachionus plicatilis TaxID=10195 RepID=A0A3M7T436_BRAPC|nr:cathepsin L1-like [Brachionus plicatilis]
MFFLISLLLFCIMTINGLTLPKKDESLEEEWRKFKQDYNKDYENEAIESYRRSVWESNLAYIENFNSNWPLFTLKMNKFGDLTNREYRDIYLGFKPRQNLNKNFDISICTSQIPESIDWRERGYVTPVKDQGQCGSCWAFSAVASLEGQNFNKTGNMVRLSEQNLVDCSKNDRNSGCNGGTMNAAFIYIRDNNGINTEESYPYEGIDGECRFRPENVGATLTRYEDVASDNECALTKAIANVGPISVAIDASLTTFQFYSSGVYYDPFCTRLNLNHGVTAVGYGVSTNSSLNEEYYIVKNSWGEDWGDNGYILMSRNRLNNCGIASEASYPII